MAPPAGRLAATALAGLVACVTLGAQQAERARDFRYKSGVDLVNVTATVTDADGHVVPNLTRDDFIVHEDGERQDIAYFERERVAVSLGIVLDTSASMAGDKIEVAQQAIRRFMVDLLHPDDELFLIRFSDEVDVVHRWTRDRERIAGSIRRITPDGATALYDAVAEAVVIANEGTHPKKALVVISDGNDTGSTVTPRAVRGLIRQSDVLVYAIGIDSRNDRSFNRQPVIPPQFPPPTYPGPIPRQPTVPRRPPVPTSPTPWTRSSDPVDADTLRALTDDSGGRTEILTSVRGLGAATAGIADELGQQYFLGYASTRPRDGRWHEIEVTIRGDRGHVVRARRGYQAAP